MTLKLYNLKFLEVLKITLNIPSQIVRIGQDLLMLSFISSILKIF